MPPLEMSSDATPVAKAKADSTIRTPRGTAISCSGWQQEAALRMLLNSYDPTIADRIIPLSVQGDIQPPARNEENLQTIVETLKTLRDDQTVIVAAGRSIGVLHTSSAAPRVVIVNSGAAQDDADRSQSSLSDGLGLEMFRQLTAGSWIHTGAQGILQGTYEVFAAAAQRHFGGDLAGKFVVSGGMGRMGGAQPLAATMNGAAFLGIDVDQDRIKQCIRAGYCDICVNSLDEAIRILKAPVRKRQGVSVGLVGNTAEIVPELARRGIVPDLLTDQTGAHHPLRSYIPYGMTLDSAEVLRRDFPADYRKRSYDSIARHVTAILELRKLGSVAFEFGNSLRKAAFDHGEARDAYQIPEFFPAYIHPLLEAGRTPMRWVALSGERQEVRRLDEVALELLGDDAVSSRWIRQAGKFLKFSGLPARICWMANSEQRAFVERVNRLVSMGEVKAPVVIGRTALEIDAVTRALIPRELITDETLADSSFRSKLMKLFEVNPGAAWLSVDQRGGTDGDLVGAIGRVIVAAGLE